MLLRSGREKPYQMPLHGSQSVEKQLLLTNMRTAPGKPVFSLRETVKCYILTEDSKTVHFDIDEDGHHEISTKDSQSHEDIAWLSVFTRNEAAVTDKPLVGIKDSKNLVILTQRSKLNEFVLLCKGKKHLSLKVLKASCSEPDYPSMERCNMKTCNHEDPDFKQLSEDNNFFIMHYQGDSVQFQCYEDTSYYLCVNDDSLDIRKLENKEPNEDKKFYFRVSYLQEK
ncbi:uncharacterized protein LOC104685182 isoform X1 [Corvus cornix cornix]|nr:uncharacterized protein LOC104685182 isoform X1 [Corvus cornix cornix]XP_017588319.1 PREDICTED: uncharacterized protein LOC108446370 isoform X1 [Corvus brachyrhynchos]XP_017588320.1 PREDICTED: uncharacterized protein LOC108446370 isoform X1 [Corvus brachyrhynchos]XP_019137403.2 uncharacterized protein LOC104685182 isoform X1 [Corvus cornix cornix]XP_031953119.1 uncharacterized protein LOC116438364 isoform X1 [Corvus moneduloides]XP_031953120.1 uncharacterized protein LOC116438364 isoform X1